MGKCWCIIVFIVGTLMWTCVSAADSDQRSKVHVLSTSNGTMAKRKYKATLAHSQGHVDKHKKYFPVNSRMYVSLGKSGHSSQIYNRFRQNHNRQQVANVSMEIFVLQILRLPQNGVTLVGFNGNRTEAATHRSGTVLGIGRSLDDGESSESISQSVTHGETVQPSSESEEYDIQVHQS